MRGCWGRVLIETLWNVNGYKGRGECLFDVVLIETLWNVNEFKLLNLFECCYGFNRNIVECK